MTTTTKAIPRIIRRHFDILLLCSILASLNIVALHKNRLRTYRLYTEP